MTDRLRLKRNLRIRRDAGRANESDGSERERCLRLVAILQSGRKWHLQLTMADSDLERLRRDTNQTTSMVKTLVGVNGLGCFVEWASAELKSVAADFNHALILFRKGEALEIVLTNKEFEAWRALVNKDEPTRYFANAV